MGFLDSALDFLKGLSEVAAPYIPQIPLPPTGPQSTDPTQAPAVEAGVVQVARRILPELAAGGAGALLGGYFGGGNGALVPRAGGVIIAGTTPGLYHTTAVGRRLPNRISFAQDESGRADFFVHAGNPTQWSRISFKKSKPRHHHHRPY